ncbi:hypothetical protein ACH5RR_013006 [Cinchona calisaya]|uniref:Uncharacterized protein n=1 Tax=Cinchona calisaya TaxID=153742 RepID=A0ABD2ZYX3_9GENT
MKTLKKHFNIVHDMLCGPNSSGFRYDDNNKCVNAEKPVWDDYLKSHKDAQKIKGKWFPYYRELYIVFGTDRATGKDDETPIDVIEELNMEAHENQSKNNVDDFARGINAIMEFMQTSKVGNTSDNNLNKKRKMASDNTEDFICEIIKDFAAMISSKVEASSERLSLAIEDANVNDQKCARKAQGNCGH